MNTWICCLCGGGYGLAAGQHLHRNMSGVLQILLKYISLLSIVQSQPTHTPSARNQTTGFSFKEPLSGLWQKLWKTNSMHFVKGKRGSFHLTKCIEFVFHSKIPLFYIKKREFFLQNAWSLFFLVFGHRPDDVSLKLKPVAWLRAEGVCVGCDCTIDKSEINFGIYIPTGMSNI